MHFSISWHPMTIDASLVQAPFLDRRLSTLHVIQSCKVMDVAPGRACNPAYPDQRTRLPSQKFKHLDKRPPWQESHCDNLYSRKIDLLGIAITFWSKQCTQHSQRRRQEIWSIEQRVLRNIFSSLLSLRPPVLWWGKNWAEKLYSVKTKLQQRVSMVPACCPLHWRMHLVWFLCIYSCLILGS